MSLLKYDISVLRRHTKARRAIRALATFGFLISLLLIAFDSVSLGFGVSNDTVIPVNIACQLDYCYTGAGLWSGLSGLIASLFGLIALRSCRASKTRHAVYFSLCLFSSLCNTIALLIGWACDTSLFDCLRYHQDGPSIDRSLKIMAIMYSCLILEVFVHMVSNNASIAFALYNCCLSDPTHCETCHSAIRDEKINNSISAPAVTDFELPERAVDSLSRNLSKTRMLSQTDFPKANYTQSIMPQYQPSDFPKANYTQSLPRYVVLSRGPTNV